MSREMLPGKAAAAIGKMTNSGLAFFVLLLCAVSLPLRAEKLAEFQEPFQFPAFAVDEDRVYVWDSQCVIHIYSRKDFAHLGQFGRKGQGPSDFEFIEYVRVLPDRLCIGQGQKISYFSKSGGFIKVLTNPNPTTGAYVPIGPNFVGTRYLPGDPGAKLNTLAVSLYDSKFELIREIYQAEVPASTPYNYEKGKKDALVVQGCCKYEVYDNHLYMGDTGLGLFFRVFDHRGEKLYDINRSYEKRKISSGEIKKMMTGSREALGEQLFNRMKNIYNQYIFPEFYPAFADFSVVDGKLYVFSYPIPDRPRMVTILDLRGNLIREIKVPESGLHRASGGQSYCVYKGRYYYMIYNEESDKWELHVENLG